MLDAIFSLIVHGDYVGWWSAIGIEEDSPLIDFILSSTGR